MISRKTNPKQQRKRTKSKKRRRTTNPLSKHHHNRIRLQTKHPLKLKKTRSLLTQIPSLLQIKTANLVLFLKSKELINPCSSMLMIWKQQKRAARKQQVLKQGLSPSKLILKKKSSSTSSSNKTTTSARITALILRTISR